MQSDKIDLTGLVQKWHGLQNCCAIILFLALDRAAALAFGAGLDWATSDRAAEPLYAEYAASAAAIVYCIYLVRQMWRYSGMATETALNRLRTAMRTLAVGCSVLVVLGLVAIAASPAEAMSTVVFMSMAAIFLLMAIFSLRSIRAIRRFAISGLHTTLLELLKTTQTKAVAAPPAEMSWMRLGQPIGLAWVLGGALTFFVAAAVGQILQMQMMDAISSGSHSSILGHAIDLLRVVEVAGVMGIFKGRAYFLPKAETVLAVDRRAPILYLRSFLDEKPDSAHLMGGFSHFDRSYEMKLARYFSSYGPFVAIGSPKDKLPKLGALRLIRSDDEWRDEVAALMDNAQRIVASVGVSHWIKWELAQLAERKFLNKTVFLFPTTVKSAFRVQRKRREQQSQRIESFAHSLHVEAGSISAALEKNEFLLAGLIVNDNVTLLTCRNLGANPANALFLAAMVAHCVLERGDQKVAEAQPVSPSIAATELAAAEPA